MTQEQLITAIDGLMPEIVRTKQPEQAMLKFAHEHNLAPSQLERLGQVFNTSKTLVCLEKSASRGDSCSLVDVPSMVSSYTTYSPEKVLDQESKQVHKQVNKIIKNAYANDGWEAVLAPVVMQKAASSDGVKEGSALPDMNDIIQSYYRESASKDAVVTDVSNASDWIELADRKPEYDIMHKKASAQSEEAPKLSQRDIRMMQKKAAEEMAQIAYETKCYLQEKCAALRQQFVGRGEKWAEAVEDIWDTYGEKSASVLRFIEDYFNATKFMVQYPDLEKRAFVRPLVQDRHNLLDTVEEMIEVMEMHKDASAGPPPPSPVTPTSGTTVSPADILESLPPADRVQLIESLKDSVDEHTESLLKGMKSPFFKVEDSVMSPLDKFKEVVKNVAPTKDERRKTIDTAVDEAKKEAVLQQLLLSDPIIAEHEPDKVKDLFNTLANAMPHAVTDVNIMGPALKEALQYGQVPVQLLKDYSAFEGQTLKNKELQQNIDRNEYHV